MRTSMNHIGNPFRCTQIKMYSWDNAQVVLAGNKCDLEQDRAVTQERGQRLADQLGKLDVRLLLSLSLGLLLSVSICCVVSYVFQRVLQIKTHSWDKTPVILIGNKCDMVNERVVHMQEGKKLADDLGKVFFVSSHCHSQSVSLPSSE